MSQQEPESPLIPPVDPLDVNLPIETLLQVDPLELAESDLTFFARYYRATRLQFEELENRPKAVKSTRGPKLNEQQTDEVLNKLLAGMIPQRPKPQPVPEPEEEELELEDEDTEEGEE